MEPKSDSNPTAPPGEAVQPPADPGCKDPPRVQLGARIRTFLRKWGLTLCGVALIIFMLWRFEHGQVYHPDRVLAAQCTDLGQASEDVWFEAKDGTRLNGWFFLGPTQTYEDTAILYCHGNGGNISHRLDVCSAMLKAGAAVFVFDYRGYGRSEGRPSEEGTYQDAQAALEWMKVRGFKRIIVFGESLGGGVAAEVARREPVAGLVLQSSFTSVPDIGAELFPWLPVRWLARIRYDTISKLPLIKVPVLVMHSRADTLIPFRHAERNFAAAKEPKFFEELTGDHNEAADDVQVFAGGLERFLKVCATNAAPQAPAGQ